MVTPYWALVFTFLCFGLLFGFLYSLDCLKMCHDNFFMSIHAMISSFVMSRDCAPVTLRGEEDTKEDAGP